MVAIPTHKNDERGSRKPHNMEAYVGERGEGGEWHNRGNVWDMMATCWAGKKEWMITRKEQNSPKDNHMFITDILNKMKLPTEHRQTENKIKEKRCKKKTPRDLGPEDITVHAREGGPTVQLCGDNHVACKWINGEIARGTKYKEIIGKIQRNLHSWWKRGAAVPISNIDNFVKHVYREHDQEADHWADIGAQGT